MLKKYPFIKWTLLFFGSLIIFVFAFGWWFISLLSDNKTYVDISTTQISELPYVSQNIISPRGKILAVVTSTDKMGSTDKKTGYELTELSRAYYVFQANGFEVDIASPEGGNSPVIIDDEDMGEFDYAFLNDHIAQDKTKNTMAIKDIDPKAYEAVFFVGGKGAMFDFPKNKAIQNIIKVLYQSNKVVGAVCHGPAALVNVTLDTGKPLLENKKVSGFTNNEELLLISDAKEIFPFLLQDKLMAQGAQFNEGEMYLENISHDNNLITGQNPWSTWALAETMISQLGYSPKYRKITDEENAVKIVSVYKAKGIIEAKEIIEQMILIENKEIKRELIAQHGIVAVMKGNINRFFGLVRLVSFVKRTEQNKIKP
ncbi:type 1 glutamine amidotransferase domain-containing protein [Aquimarina sp. AU474]|uniref:type 1 glutamine amidotransferase domain-containing protein n=1 Tax=Aquimarina sp. AU474 TaxID=2108529 RepID=UPI000D69C75A|nr:type 1 glutamine amidotransferase domain-containing protein [Aquimarina sp. AU474]